MSASLVSVIIVTYNSDDDIADCLRSVIDQDTADFEVIVVDNCSTDRTVEIVKQDFPTVGVVKNDQNYGVAKGNNVGVDASRSKYVVLLNPDVVVEPRWLPELVRVMEEDEHIGACQSKILLHDKPDTINTEGHEINYLGFTWCRHYGKKDTGEGEIHEIPAFSGCSTILRTDLFEQDGLADEDFFMYLEDTDLSLRIWRMGYKIVCNPGSVLRHKYRFGRGNQKIYYLERNRLMLLLKHYSTGGLLKILPVFLFMEVGLVLLSLHQRWFKQKVLSYIWIVKNWRAIRSKRGTLKRRKGDQQKLFSRMSPTITFEEIQNPLLLKVVNPLLRVYYECVVSR